MVLNNKSIILGVVFIFAILTGLLPIVYAEVELTIPFNQEFDLKRPCFNNGTFCSSSAVCNITITYPDGDILTNNQQMTNQNSFHNVTLTNLNISQLGIMPVVMVCDDPTGAVNGSAQDTFEIEVTGDGFRGLPFPLQFSVIALAFILIFISFFDDRMKLFRIIGGLMLMGMGVVTLFPGYANFNYSTLQGQILGISIIGLGLFFTIQDSLSFDRQVDHVDQADDGRFHG